MCMNLTQQVTNRFLAPKIPEAIWGKYFKGKKMCGISEPDFLDRINGTMLCVTCAILCHTRRAWQTGVHLETCDFKPEAIGGEPDPEASVLSFRLGCSHDVELERPFWPAAPDVGLLPRLGTDYDPQAHSRDHQSKDQEGAQGAGRSL